MADIDDALASRPTAIIEDDGDPDTRPGKVKAEPTLSEEGPDVVGLAAFVRLGSEELGSGQGER